MGPLPIKVPNSTIHNMPKTCPITLIPNENVCVKWSLVMPSAYSCPLHQSLSTKYELPVFPKNSNRKNYFRWYGFVQNIQDCLIATSLLCLQVSGHLYAYIHPYRNYPMHISERYCRVDAMYFLLSLFTFFFFYNNSRTIITG